ncbi:synaptic vesicle glycoprotein 2B-like [Chironomus tepperi]|uniref:synaptic vesicle glycoprotein 2B-like n=1 Tax=Chironomus tepperi TaxID=113505 RepID=UPI00391F0144
MPPNCDKHIAMSIDKISTIEVKCEKFKEKKIIAYEDALKSIGFGRVQIELLLASFLILLNVMNETMGISFIIPVAQCDMNLSQSDKGLLSGIIFVAMIIPSYGWGIMAGLMGRRTIIFWSVLGSSIFTCLGAFVSDFKLFLLCRFFSGLFVAGYSGVIYTYIGEFCIMKHRAILISWASVSVGLSLIIMPFTASVILSYNWKLDLIDFVDFAPWRILLVIFTLPGIIGILWLFRLPESPKFLLLHNRKEEALEIVKWIHIKNLGESKKFDIDDLQSEESDDDIEFKKYTGIKKILLSMKEQTLPLLKPPYLLYFVICCCLQYGIFCIAGGLALFLPDILNKIANTYEVNPMDSFKICDIFNSDSSINLNVTKFADRSCDETINPSVFIDSMFLGLAFTIAYIATSLFMKPKRRKYIIGITLFTSCLSGALLNFSESQYFMIVLICSFVMLSGINSAIISGVACDIFPTKQISTVICIMMIFSRVGTATSSSFIGYLLDHDCELAYHALPVITLFCFILSLMLPT